MKVQGKNASVERTRQRIYDALIEMHSERIAGDKMTVGELARRAGISRSTFYTHYSDLYEVGTEMAETFSREALDTFSIHSCNQIPELTEHILSIFNKYLDNFSKMMSSDYPVIFMRIFRARFKKKIQISCENEIVNNSVLAAKVSIFADVMISQISDCLQGKATLFTFDDLSNAIIMTSKEMFR